MRLIDADAFERKVMFGDEEDLQDVIYSLRDFPTAYDVDKVVNELGKASGLARPVGWSRKKEIVELKTTIEIVKGGLDEKTDS